MKIGVLGPLMPKQGAGARQTQILNSGLCCFHQDLATLWVAGGTG